MSYSVKEAERIKNESKTTFSNPFFKNKKKLELAESIANKMDIQELLENTIYIIPDTCKVYIDYPVFKLYANPTNYILVVDRVLNLFNRCLEKYNEFEVHVNLNSFTISAAERYKPIIELFCTNCFKENTQYAKLVKRCCLYNSPNVLDIVSKLFNNLIDKRVKEIMEMYTKDKSTELIEKLFEI